MFSAVTTQIDVRVMAPRDRHALIFEAFDVLKAGEVIELLNDHDPAPLRQQLVERSPGGLDWSYLLAGPDLWRVRIAKLQTVAVPVAVGSCCSGGACCG